MPGVCLKGLKVSMLSDTIFYEGEAPKESEYEDCRHYSGTLTLLPGWCEKKEVIAEVNNGVVIITMPSMKC